MKESTLKKHIINWLIDNHKPFIIACEHEYLFGSRRADIIYIDESGIHAIEIKSKHDDARRLKSQLPLYLASFHSVSVAFDEKKVDPEAKNNKSAGIILVSEDGKTEIKRKAYKKSRIRKKDILMLVPLVQLKKRLANKSIHHPKKVIEELSRKMDSKEIEKFTISALVEKYEEIYKTFQLESGRIFNEDDLSILERKSQKVIL